MDGKTKYNSNGEIHILLLCYVNDEHSIYYSNQKIQMVSFFIIWCHNFNKGFVFTHDVSLSEPFHASCMPYTLDCNPTFTIFTD